MPVLQGDGMCIGWGIGVPPAAPCSRAIPAFSPYTAFFCRGDVLSCQWDAAGALSCAVPDWAGRREERPPHVGTPGGTAHWPRQAVMLRLMAVK